jgi:xanthine dehydrogenase large subunit
LFYRTPDIFQFDFEKQIGRPFNYFTFGASCSEVEIETGVPIENYQLGASQ